MFSIFFSSAEPIVGPMHAASYYSERRCDQYGVDQIHPTQNGGFTSTAAIG